VERIEGLWREIVDADRRGFTGSVSLDLNKSSDYLPAVANWNGCAPKWIST